MNSLDHIKEDIESVLALLSEDIGKDRLPSEIHMIVTGKKVSGRGMEINRRVYGKNLEESMYTRKALSILPDTFSNILGIYGDGTKRHLGYGETPTTINNTFNANILDTGSIHSVADGVFGDVNRLTFDILEIDINLVEYLYEKKVIKGMDIYKDVYDIFYITLYDFYTEYKNVLNRLKANMLSSGIVSFINNIKKLGQNDIMNKGNLLRDSSSWDYKGPVGSIRPIVAGVVLQLMALYVIKVLNTIVVKNAVGDLEDGDFLFKPLEDFILNAKHMDFRKRGDVALKFFEEKMNKKEFGSKIVSEMFNLYEAMLFDSADELYKTSTEGMYSVDVSLEKNEGKLKLKISSDSDGTIMESDHDDVVSISESIKAIKDGYEFNHPKDIVLFMVRCNSKNVDSDEMMSEAMGFWKKIRTKGRKKHILMIKREIDQISLLFDTMKTKYDKKTVLDRAYNLMEEIEETIIDFTGLDEGYVNSLETTRDILRMIIKDGNQKEIKRLNLDLGIIYPEGYEG